MSELREKSDLTPLAGMPAGKTVTSKDLHRKVKESESRVKSDLKVRLSSLKEQYEALIASEAKSTKLKLDLKIQTIETQLSTIKTQVDRKDEPKRIK